MVPYSPQQPARSAPGHRARTRASSWKTIPPAYPFSAIGNGPCIFRWYSLRALQPLEAVIHIGPHKTGSTSIETALIVNTDIRRALEQDGYAVPDQFPGHFPMHSAKNPANLVTELYQPGLADGATWRWFAAYANHSFASRKKLLFASESLSSFVPAENLEQLATMLTKDVGYAVRVVMVYRRENQRLVSMYTETSLREIASANVTCHLPLVDYLERDGGVPHEFYQNLIRKFHSLGRVELLNLHAIPNGSSLVQKFVCRHLHAPRACAALRSGSARATTMNDGSSRALNAPLFAWFSGRRGRTACVRSTWESRCRPSSGLGYSADRSLLTHATASTRRLWRGSGTRRRPRSALCCHGRSRCRKRPHCTPTSPLTRVGTARWTWTGSGARSPRWTKRYATP